MRIERTGRFKRDYRRALRGRHKEAIETIFIEVLTTLIQGKSLDPKHRDHALSGSWNDHRDCHIKPDLILIYRLVDVETLQLVRLGSHSELGL